MSGHAVQVEGISKRYRIGMRRQIHDTLTGALLAMVRSPLHNLKQLQRLIRFDPLEEDDVIWALREVSFDVKQGEVIGIIGRNGAGKSTLLKILSRITDPTSGTARIQGRVSSLLEVGTGFHPELTGRENVYLNGTILGMRKREIDSKFDEIVDFSGVEQFIDTPVKRYSSGMQVRLAFSVAAHLEPEILLVDEVLAVGDAEFQKKCIGKMSDVAQQGRTVLFVSHNMLAIQSLCRRAILLEDARISADGEPEAVLRKYLSGIQELEQIPLDQRQDRDGGELLRFTASEFLNPFTLQRLDGLISGAPVLIRLHYENRSPDRIKNVGLGLYIFNQTRSYLVGFTSKSAGLLLSAEPGSNFADCFLEKWPLQAGQYLFDLRAEVNDFSLDYIREAGSISVEPGDFFGTGSVPGFGHPSVLVRHEWNPVQHFQQAYCGKGTNS